ncbi:hypothetical protein GCM10011575_23430 [Microlunatus endophyticus]|uniref:ABC-2 family transporter protein n=1 Tax=Microlunatus endophyticus TaxID=1716077 RepID=A0A917SA99_9ACTN|nr:hypothetical protein [Microlunatus endophyticus]GGL64327.1 hypothetical protein GCM10011575_23430 [Microlunatus endophyticus]
MTTVLASEVRKIATTRGWIIMICITAGVSLVFSGIFALVGLIGPTEGNVFTHPEFIAAIYTGNNQAARVVAIIAGALMMGQEFRYKTLSSSYLAVPNRTKVVGGKAIVTFGYGLAFGLVATVAGFIVATVFVLIKNGSLALGHRGTWQALLLNIVAIALWAMIGFGFGILIKNMLASVLIAVGFAYIIEPIISVIFALQHWTVPANLMPSSATSTLLGVDATSAIGAAAPGGAGWPAWAGLLVLLGWAVIPAVVGIITTVRQDVA